MSVCVSVCLSLREDISGTTRDLYQIFVHPACVRGSVLLRHVYDRPHHLSPGRGFLPLKDALSAGKGGWECTARAKYAIYDCLVCVVNVINCRCMPTDYLFLLSCEKYQHMRYVHSVHIHRVSKTSHLWLAITLMHMNGFGYFLAEMLPIKYAIK